MGQQQLILIALIMILVGIAVWVGIIATNDAAVSSNRDAVTNHLIGLATRAQGYYRTSGIHGGGEGSFVGITLGRITAHQETADGNFFIQGVRTDRMRLVGTGKELADDGRPVRVRVSVFADSISVVRLN